MNEYMVLSCSQTLLVPEEKGLFMFMLKRRTSILAFSHGMVNKQ